MNFLAHLWLAERTGTSLAGAVLGDVVRGVDLSAYPNAVAHGIRLHRRVDAATDRHPLLRAARQQWPEGQRRHAGIVLDLACDYALATDWARHADEPLDQFATRAGTALADAAHWFRLAGGRSPNAVEFAQLLQSYGTAHGINLAVTRIARRLRQPEPLLIAAQRWPAAIPDLQQALPDVLADLQGLAERLIAE